MRRQTKAKRIKNKNRLFERKENGNFNVKEEGIQKGRGRSVINTHKDKKQNEKANVTGTIKPNKTAASKKKNKKKNKKKQKKTKTFQYSYLRIQDQGQIYATKSKKFLQNTTPTTVNFLVKRSRKRKYNLRNVIGENSRRRCNKFRKKIIIKNKKKKGGFCGNCKKKYPNLKRHLKSQTHRNFSSNENNFQKIDRFFTELSNQNLEQSQSISSLTCPKHSQILNQNKKTIKRKKEKDKDKATTRNGNNAIKNNVDISENKDKHENWDDNGNDNDNDNYNNNGNNINEKNNKMDRNEDEDEDEDEDEEKKKNVQNIFEFSENFFELNNIGFPNTNIDNKTIDDPIILFDDNTFDWKGGQFDFSNSDDDFIEDFHPIHFKEINLKKKDKIHLLKRRRRRRRRIRKKKEDEEENNMEKKKQMENKKNKVQKKIIKRKKKKYYIFCIFFLLKKKFF
ncbi:protein dbf4 [Anaeramoeba flamelloides]|uniref:Protein dbf4 n=1 Tax=Anaeramoeba flamelloides TaxID=1746091 RepID=A0ABQ8XA64_9EUKA|nr:protein dbf4 [Anaeramoeba flamelloides]